MRLLFPFVLAIFMLLSCGRRSEGVNASARDPHSYSNPAVARVRHLELDLTADFDRSELKGSVVLHLDRAQGGDLVLDTRDLAIDSIEVRDGETWKPAKWTLGSKDAILGTPLTISGGDTEEVRIHYSTSPHASALQWLTPEQTAGKKLPFLFTQSQAIHARSWVPCQDTPAVRFTFEAHVQTPKELLAVMAAENEARTLRDGDYRFNMPQPIPSYLLALAVGDMERRDIGPRSAIYAEPKVLEKAAREFEDTEKMILAAESLFGPYRWGRYDILVLPPSFPFGGMENPRLTFATPAVLAGDKSLVALVAHELAHSWAGNLVTNATWNDFWLNEGFTVFLERRILERLYGRERAEMEAAIARQDLEREMAALEPRDQVLRLDLRGRDPEEGVTGVAYEKGYLFLRALSEATGGSRFNAFLRGYFDHFAFQSISTEQFVSYLNRNLEVPATVRVEEWLTKPGLPVGAPTPESPALEDVRRAAAGWRPGKKIEASGWGPFELLQFLKALPPGIGEAGMKELDGKFRFSRTANSEVLFEWLRLVIANRYRAAYPRVEEFLTSVGRTKYVRPLFEEMVKSPEGVRWAGSVYAKARPGYHPLTQAAVERVLSAAGGQGGH